MSRKFNTKHDRKRSRYPKRLASRGFSKAPRMTPLSVLRRSANPKDEAGIREAESLERN